MKLTKKEVAILGGQANAKNFNKDENKIIAYDLYKKGFTQKEIANKLNVSQCSVSVYLKEHQPEPIRKRTRKYK